QSQEMFVNAEAELFISPGDVLYINNNLTVNNNGNLTVRSDESSSGSLLVSGTANGNIIYERYIPSDIWHIFSSPVTTQEINSFANADNSIVTKEEGSKFALGNYTNSNSSGLKWEYYTDSSLPSAGNFISGKGYAAKRENAGYYTFKGNMTTTDVDFVMNSSDNDFWSCVGNPYPSFTLASMGGSSESLLKNNIQSLDQSYIALYFWDESEYRALNLISDGDYIAPGQGVFVNAASNNETFTFSQSLQNHQSEGTTFYRSAEHPTIKLFLNDNDGQTSTTLKYIDDCSLGLDPGYDAGAFKLGNHAPELSIYTQLVEENQNIDNILQCLPNFELESYPIPVSVSARAGSNIEFSASLTNFPEDTYVYLEDTENKQITDLKQGNYQLNVKDDLAGIGRFYLFTSSEERNVTEEVVKPINIYTTERELIISGLSEHEDATLKLYNVLGQEVYSKQLKDAQTTSISLANLPSAIYITKINTNKRLISKKIIVENE
ncbi:MAG: T9SS type A sorting domain-containing protein, partial [Flavobacteriales bacterium]|nr:T9SS type A sorting domain-containing protein [Flavobacteriales bacterium]